MATETFMDTSTPGEPLTEMERNWANWSRFLVRGFECLRQVLPTEVGNKVKTAKEAPQHFLQLVDSGKIATLSNWKRNDDAVMIEAKVCAPNFDDSMSKKTENYGLEWNPSWGDPHDHGHLRLVPVCGHGSIYHDSSLVVYWKMNQQMPEVPLAGGAKKRTPAAEFKQFFPYEKQSNSAFDGGWKINWNGGAGLTIPDITDRVMQDHLNGKYGEVESAAADHLVLDPSVKQDDFTIVVSNFNGCASDGDPGKGILPDFLGEPDRLELAFRAMCTLLAKRKRPFLILGCDARTWGYKDAVPYDRMVEKFRSIAFLDFGIASVTGAQKWRFFNINRPVDPFHICADGAHEVFESVAAMLYEIVELVFLLRLPIGLRKVLDEHGTDATSVSEDDRSSAAAESVMLPGEAAKANLELVDQLSRTYRTTEELAGVVEGVTSVSKKKRKKKSKAAIIVYDKACEEEASAAAESSPNEWAKFHRSQQQASASASAEPQPSQTKKEELSSDEESKLEAKEERPRVPLFENIPNVVEAPPRSQKKGRSFPEEWNLDNGLRDGLAEARTTRRVPRRARP